MINWFKKLPKLSRKGKIIRNLAVCALVLAALPWVLDWPTNDSEEVFRRLERQALLSPSELVLQVGEAFLTEGEDWVAAGEVHKYSSSWKPFQKKTAYINYVLPKGELTVIPLPDSSTEKGLVVAVHSLPEHVTSGLLEITVSIEDRRGENFPAQETFKVAAEREGDWLFFEVRSHGKHDETEWCIMGALWWEMTLGSGVPEYPYTLELYDADGNTVERVESTLPRSNRFLYSNFWA